MRNLNTKSFDHGINNQLSNKKIEMMISVLKKRNDHSKIGGDIVVKELKEKIYTLRKRYNYSRRSEMMQGK